MTDSSPAVVVPRVTTARLLLREVRITDFETYMKHAADPRSARFVPAPADGRSGWRILASLTGAWMLTGAGWWAIELRETGAFFGPVGVFSRATLLPLRPDTYLVVGCTVSPRYGRQGFALEAAAAAMHCGLSRNKAPRVIAHMDPENARSVAVAKALGMSLEGPVEFYGLPTIRYAITRDAASQPPST